MPPRPGVVRNVVVFAVLSACAWWIDGRVIGDGPVLPGHVDQQRIDRGELSFQQLFDAGKLLFSVKFNAFDGQGRPATRGDGMPRVAGSAPRFIRTAGPDANSCAACHNDPFAGAAGDIVADVFVLAQTLDPVNPSVSSDFSNERNTLGMNGAGAVELLAREMTADLIAIRTAALVEAKSGNVNVIKPLVTKGVSFGAI